MHIILNLKEEIHESTGNEKNVYKNIKTYLYLYKNDIKREGKNVCGHLCLSFYYSITLKNIFVLLFIFI